MKNNWSTDNGNLSASLSRSILTEECEALKRLVKQLKVRKTVWKKNIILYSCFSAVSTIMIQAKLNQNVDLLCAVTRFYKFYPLLNNINRFPINVIYMYNMIFLWHILTYYTPLILPFNCQESSSPITKYTLLYIILLFYISCLL